MNLLKKLFPALVVFLAFSSAATAAAGDFDWVENFNVRADADPSGFRARLAARFKVADTQVEVVLGKVRAPADAYIIFRLGEMAERPADYVLKKYKSGKSKGWGALAQSLGIKPGSKEFHALKRGDDLYDDSGKGEGGGKGKGKGKSKSKS
jgi:hypothetical protein